MGVMYSNTLNYFFMPSITASDFSKMGNLGQFEGFVLSHRGPSIQTVHIGSVVISFTVLGHVGISAGFSILGTHQTCLDVAFTGDISKMFLKIQQPEEYKKYSRVIWRDKDRESCLVYEFNGHLFGNNGSPTVAMWTVQKNAQDHKEEFPEAAECVLKSTIVDDHLDSCPTAAGAIKIVTKLVKMYKKIGLKLAKVTTNNAEVLKKLPEAVETSENMKDFSQEIEISVGTESKMPHMRALGQRWNMLLDEFLYKSYTPDLQIFCTKQYCLYQLDRLFDPLEFITPILLLTKIFIQALWKRSAKWLDALTEEETEEWTEWLTNLPILHQMRFPRVLKKGLPSTYKSVQMHVFADASKVCFAAVAYIRIEYRSGSSQGESGCKAGGHSNRVTRNSA
jgi:hypothetical protein